MNEQICGCCKGITTHTPLKTANRAGLDRLVYRVGTHATFLESMVARLSNLHLDVSLEDGSGNTKRVYPLRDKLTTRRSDDPAIAMLDAWATVADVLTFYQERFANEGYLLTAVQRRSLLELARLVGYRLRPGVAATVFLAFELEKEYQVEIPAGVRTQSIPGPGELPQAFETAEAIPARAEWNEMKPRLKRPQDFSSGRKTAFDLYLQGTTTNLKVNDSLLLVFGKDGDDPYFWQIQAVQTQIDDDRTKVSLRFGMERTSAMMPRSAVGDLDEQLSKLLQLDTHHIIGSSESIKWIVRQLEGLRERLHATTSAQERRRVIEQVHSRLSGVLATLPANASNQRAWLKEILQCLEVALTAAPSSAAPPDLTNVDSEAENPTIGKFDVGLLKQLTRLPSIQPRSARLLPYDLTEVWTPEAAGVTRLVSTLQTQLHPDLYYKALAGAKVTKSTDLDTVQALRVKAAPFGHNAPLKTIYDDAGQILYQEERPLANVLIGLSLSFNGEGSIGERGLSPPLTVHISRNARTETASFALISASNPEVKLINNIEVAVTAEIETSQGSSTQIIRSVAVETLGESIKLTAVQSTSDSALLAVTDGYANTLYPGGSDVWYDHVEKRQVRVVFAEDLTSYRFTLETSPDSLVTGLREELMHRIALDRLYDEIEPGSWVVVRRTDKNLNYFAKVLSVAPVGKTDYGLTGQVTQLVLNKIKGDDWLESTDTMLTAIRNTVVHLHSEPLTYTDEPFVEEVAGDSIELDGLYQGLEAGRWMIVSGERTDIASVTGVKASELVMLTAVSEDTQKLPEPAPDDNGETCCGEHNTGCCESDGDCNGVNCCTNGGSDNARRGDTLHTKLSFAEPLAYRYKRDTVTIYGNVAKATHGETREEVLGSGDGTQARQHFTLKQKPLTHLAAVTPSGSRSTLEVRVDNVQWHEAENPFILGANDRRFITKTDNDDNTGAIFGDGEHGTRLPSGVENVKAVYRNGIGKIGNVAAEQISLLATRPLGVRGVINPMPASGGADREDKNQARHNAPLKVMALDRLVSVQDYADFVRIFAGVGKADARRLRDGVQQVVHITIAGADQESTIDRTSDLYQSLQQAVHVYGDPGLPVQIDEYERMVLVITARVRVAPDYEWESVAPGVRKILYDTFGFARRQLGQDVMASEVIASIQGVAGVAYVDLDLLADIKASATVDPTVLEEALKAIVGNNGPRRPEERIRVRLAGYDAEKSRLVPAQLALLNPKLPETLILEVIP